MKVILFTIYLLSLISCQNKKNSKLQSNPRINLTAKTMTDSTIFEQLDIDNLKETLENSQIRIWIAFSLIDSGKIINLKNETGNWKCEFYQYRFNLKNNNSSNKILISKNKVDGTPHSGWDKFLNQIEKFGIYNLNDSGRKHNYGLCTDGGAITIEIVKDKKYYEYIYPCWDAIEDQKEIKKVIKILQFVQQEFGFKVFPLDLEFSDLKKLIK